MLAWRSKRAKKIYAGGETDEGDAHGEANHAEHVGDLEIVGGPEHGDGEAGLVVEDSVEDHADHHEEQNVIACLRGERNRAHGAQQNQRVDAHAEGDRPEEDVLAPFEVEDFPMEVRQQLVEGNLVRGTDTDQGDDEREIEEEDAELAESLR